MTSLEDIKKIAIQGLGIDNLIWKEWESHNDFDFNSATFFLIGVAKVKENESKSYIIVSTHFDPQMLHTVAFFKSKIISEDSKDHPGDEGEDALQFMFLTNNSYNSALHLSEVIMPLLNDSYATDEYSGSSLVNLSYGEKIAATVLFASRIEESPELFLPKVEIDNVEAAAEDVNCIKQIESTSLNWLSIVCHKIDIESIRQHKGKSPIAEAEFWRERHFALVNLREQINEENVQKYLKALLYSGSPIYNEIVEKFNELSQLSIEASENNKFLSTLEKHFQILATSSISAVIAAIPSLFDSLRMVWTLSRFYNRDERLVPLMERIAMQLVDRVRVHVNVDKLLLMDPNKAKATLLEAQRTLECWRSSYMAEREHIEVSGCCFRRWEFDRTRLFADTDYVAEVCSQLRDAIVTLLQFRRFLCPEVSAVTESEGLDAVAIHVESLIDYLRETTYDIFDKVNREQWIETVAKFHSQVTFIEEAAGTTIKQIFKQLRSSESAFNLVENFSSLLSRPSIHRHINERYPDILQHYSMELSQIDKSFYDRKSSPPTFKGYNGVPAVIAWANDCYLRVRHPIIRFNSKKGLLETEIGSDVKYRYLNFARVVHSFKEARYTEWAERAASFITEGLNQGIITQDRDKFRLLTNNKYDYRNAMKISPGINTKSLVHYKTNFLQEIVDIINDSKSMSKLGYPIPESILVNALHEDSYLGYVQEINALLQEFNSIHASMSVIERKMLDRNVKILERTFAPGFTSLNWKSQRIPAFVALGHREVENVRSVLNEIRKHAETMENIISCIENYSLIHENGFKNISEGKPKNLFDFFQAVEMQRKDRLNYLVQQYQALKPVLLKIEMVIAETSTGISSYLVEYYHFWEKRVFNGIVKMTSRSLLHFHSLIRSVKLTKPLCQINVTLNGKDFAIVPSLDDIFKEFNRCIRSIPESSKEFLRWMKGTCLEAEPQKQTNEMKETIHVFSFYEDVCSSAPIASIMSFLNLEVLRMFDNVEANIKIWKDLQAKHNLWDPKRKEHMEYLRECNASVACFESQLSQLQEIRSGFNQNYSSFQGNSTKVSVGFLLVDFSDVALGFSRQLSALINECGEILHFSAKGKLDYFNTKIDKFREQLNYEPNSLEDLKTVLHAIMEISFSNMNMELEYHEVSERYNTLLRYSIDVLQDEIAAVQMIGSLWQELVMESRVKDVQLTSVKGKYIEVTKTKSVQLLEKISQENDSFCKACSVSSLNSLDDDLESIKKFQSQLSKLKIEKEQLSETEILLNMEETPFPKLKNLETSMNELSDILGIYRRLKDFLSSANNTEWASVDVTILSDRMTEFEKECHGLATASNKMKLMSVNQRISQVKESLEIVAVLKNS